jgi:membrane protease YdiL (CAAX protease family)
VRQSLGWHRGRGIWIEIAFGFLGYIAYLPILLLSAYITVILSHGQAMTHPVVPELMQAHGSHMLLIILAAVVAAPIMEETFFRGALFAHLRSRRRWIIAAPLVGLIFAAIHPQGWAAIPVIGGLGVFLCALREWRGSLIAPITAHALNNLGALTLLLIAR